MGAPKHLQSAVTESVVVGGDTFFDPLQHTTRVAPELLRLTDLLRQADKSNALPLPVRDR